MENYQTIAIERINGVSTIWLNRPEYRNAFDLQMLEELTDCYKNLEVQDDACIILRGKGKSFCAGADLNWMKSGIDSTFEQNYTESCILYDCFKTIYTCKKPTIALAHGAAMGGATGLISACDISMCTEETLFSLSEVKIGLVPSVISPFVIKRIGEFNARELMLTGRRINGKEAEYFRLVNKCIPADMIEDELKSTISVLKKNAPGAMLHCKQLIDDVCNRLSFDETRDYTARLIAELRKSREGQEGIAAFFEKRNPDWYRE